MKKWTIAPAPSPRDATRCELLIEGDMGDVLAVVQKFGASCGRPDKIASSEGYNFRIFLNKLGPDTIDKVKDYLLSLKPAAAPAASSAPKLENLAPPPAAAKPELIALTPAEPAPVAQTPPPAAPPSAAEPVSAASSGRRRGPFRVDVALDAKLNFDVMQVGSFNRFAHAAASSVVSSPGAMYNPLFLHGAPGVGKTHMLHAIGMGLAKTISPTSVALTTGTKITTAVNTAVRDLERFLESKKVLLIDDFHLVAASDTNSAALGKIIGEFLQRGRQLAVSSLYPPKALEALEEELKIPLSKGWAVDMKTPAPDAQKEMILAAFARLGVDLKNDEAAIFHDKLGNNYFEAGTWIRRLAAFKKARQESGKPGEISQLIDVLFEPATATELPLPEDLDKAKAFHPPAPAPDAQNLALVFPKGQKSMTAWMIEKFYESMQRLGAARAYNIVLATPYDMEQSFGVPFQIGELCQEAEADAALVLGPPAGSALAERLPEFSHAVRHILASLDVACGWIPHQGLKARSYYASACLDCFAAEYFDRA